jgi:hypothetical protein
MRAMKNMSFRKIFLMGVLIGLGCVSAAQAQLAVYGTVSAERLKGINCADPQHICASTDGTVRPYGGTIGTYYDFRSFGPVSLGADLRGVFLNSNKSAYSYQGGPDLIRHYSFLGGARATFKTPFKVLRPYVQVSAGLGRTNSTVPPPNFYQNFTQVQGFAGLDIALFDNVDFRAIELGAGELFGPSSHTIQSIGLGLVFHMTRENK